MNSFATYILSINFNFNIEEQTIIESRAIKRTKDGASFSVEYLKGAIKEYQDNTHFLFDELTNNFSVSIEKQLSAESFRKAMGAKFDLFNDLQTLITNQDNPTLSRLVNL